MSAVAGDRLGPYEILGPLGAGGMGEVYRARDTRLDRTVAIKMLPAHAAVDPVRRKRFEREARTVATLTHPHICTLYDVGQHEGVDFLVLEYIEGETLEARLGRGPLPLEEALRLGMQLADALDAAHRRGIVHRDIKPANIAVTSSGVKLLDFGVAALRERAGLSIEGRAPSETSSLTAEGTILGTLQYIAPEQVEGRETDHRVDLFALGAVLYEMVTGERAFTGESPASQLAAVLTSEPSPVSTVRRDAGVPLAFDHLVQRCLAKNPDERWQSMRDVMLELVWIGRAAPSIERESARLGRLGRRSLLGWAVAGLLSVVSIGLAAMLGSRNGPRAEAGSEPVRFTVTAPENGTLSPDIHLMALSPDGRRLAFVATPPGGAPFLWIRPLDSTSAHALAGTDGATAPFWSPDARSVAFVADGKLKTINIEAETVQVIASDAASFPGAWSREGIILFYRGADRIHGNIDKVSAQGGPVTPATTLDAARREVSHADPQFLSDGRHFLFVADGIDNALCLGSLDSTARTRTMTVESFDTRYVEPGYLLWHRGSTVLVQPFDAPSFRTSGRPSPIAQQVRYHMGTEMGVYSASNTGILAYMSIAVTRLAWFDRRGSPIGLIGQPGPYLHPSLSADGKWLAVSQLDPEIGTHDIWVCEIDSGAWSRLSFNPADDTRPVWSPDGRRILFASDRNGIFDLFVRSLGKDAADELIEGTPPVKWPIDWSPDGRFILYKDGMTPTPWILPLGGKPTRAPVAFDGAKDGDKLSPDGRWLAFSVNRTSGAGPDIYVASFPGGDRTWRISSTGGVEPKWRRDGKELIYLARDGRLMAVHIDTVHEFRASPPQALFQTTLRFPADNWNVPETRKQYDVTPDGQRFLLNQPVGDTPITIVVNWPAALRR